jgi:hypothetical protein
MYRGERYLNKGNDLIAVSVEAKGLPGRRFFNRMNELVTEYH